MDINWINVFNWMSLLKCFIVGGLICVIGQILIDKTKLARFHDNLKQKGLPLNDWTTGNAYKVGYIVVHNGELYRSTVAHTASSVFD